MMEGETLWASLPVPAFLVDGADRIAEVNPAAEIFLNASRRALAGAELGARLNTGGTDIGAALARVRQDQSPLFINDVALAPRGAEAPTECSLQLAPVAGDEAAVLVLVQMRRIAGKIGRSLDARSAARSAVGMAEMLAHEIKNPLAGITGAAQLLSMNLAGEDAALTDLIVAECRRIVALLDQVEQFGNLRPPRRRPANLHDLLDRARRSAELGFAAHMRFVEDYDPSLPETEVDPDQMIQVFLNLLKNAAEAAGPGGGTITLRSFYDHGLRRRRADGSLANLPLQVEIIDDGPGLPDDIAGQVFEPFVSGRENGTGLGLALVSKIVSEHDGLIAVDSAPGRTRFRLSLPKAQETRD
ncbi:MAG: PAS domain-containing sensor histidine kinase [Alphaproteobacteria bacterium]|nr:MAG: PAS domain-containing sensor histidine kinase [Alphaproteobacteria bacterium]